MLAPAALAFSRLKKRVIWALLQGEVVRRAACIHATSEQEHDEIRDFEKESRTRLPLFPME